MSRRRVQHLISIVLAALMALGFGPSAWGQLTETQQADFEIWRSVLGDAPGEPGVQRNAARRLLDSGWEESMALLGEMLGDFKRPELVGAICAAVRDMDAPPEALFEALVERLVTAPPELQADLADAIGSYPPAMLPRLIDRMNREGAGASEKVALIVALSRFTEVEVVDQLINHLDPQGDATVRAAALEALVRVTGVDYGESMTRWQSWWRNNRVQGRDGLVRRKLRRLERERNEALLRVQNLQRDVAALTSDLLSAMNRNYTLTDPEQRNALMVTLLGHPRVPVRRLGLDLVEQRVLNAEPLSPEVVGLLGRMVTDPAAPLRPLAIRRLALIDGASAASLVGPLLADATDAELEAAILAVLGQSAVASAAPALVERFIREVRPKGTTAALLVSAAAGHLDAEQMSAISQRLAAQGAENLTGAEAELLAWCPDPAVAEVLAAILRPVEGGAERRAAAARGLAASGRHREVLLAHASDPSVYPHALAAAGRQGGLEALRLILTWPVLDAARLGEEVGQILTALPAADWLEADNVVSAHEAIDVPRRVNSLSRVLTLPQPNNGSESAISAAQRRQMCLRLVELNWRRADPEAMLTALQAAPPGEGDANQEARWRNIALIALERFDSADASRGGDWVDALDLVLRQRNADIERATRIAEAIQTGRTAALSDADRQRFEALMTRLASLITSVEPGG